MFFATPQITSNHFATPSVHFLDSRREYSLGLKVLLYREISQLKSTETGRCQVGRDSRRSIVVGGRASAVGVGGQYKSPPGKRRTILRFHENERGREFVIVRVLHEESTNKTSLK